MIVILFIYNLSAVATLSTGPVAFGDKPAALALELAKELAAQIAWRVDPLAAAQLLRNSLVDDVGGGGTTLEICRMRGEKNEDATYTGTLPKMLDMVGFKAKALVASGTRDPVELDALGGKFLGLGFDATGDELVLSTAPLIRMDPKRSRQRRAQAQKIDKGWIERLRLGEKVLTRR